VLQGNLKSVDAMAKRMKKKQLHLIVGGSRGLGAALVIDSIGKDKAIRIVSRSGMSKPLGSSVFHTKCDLGDYDDLDKFTSELRSLSKNIEQITFCQRFRPPESMSDRETAMGTLKVEIISTSEIIREVSRSKGNNKISVVICSSLNAFLINRDLSLWYHVAKSANRQLMRFFSASLAPNEMYFSVIEFGSFLKSGVKLDRAKTALLEKIGRKSISRRVPTDAEAAQIINLVHQLHRNGLSGQVYSYDGGISQFAPEYLLND
jgi:NAD(P)-dependent dehydrogenase (short-subunit alcohol dehydrogenase family)